MKNGDRITGTIIKSDGKNLTFKTIRNQEEQTPYLAEIDRPNFDTSLAPSLSRWLSWRITLSDRYLSNPVPGARSNDVLLTTGIRLTFAK
ncbi:MAG: hypothetical protein ACREBD_32625 [Blastocatellia bacterium]